MSANLNVGSQSHENLTADDLQPVAAIRQVGEEMKPLQPLNEDYLLPVDQRDDYLLPVDQRDGYLLPVDQRDEYLEPQDQRDENLEPQDQRDGYLLPVDQRDEYLEPQDQRDDGYEKCNVYEDLDSYIQSGPHYDAIPLSVIPPCPPRPGGLSTTPHRPRGPEPGGSGGYLEITPTPAERPQPDRPVRTNKNIKWLVVGLAVFAVIGVVIGITVTYTTGIEATGHCTSMPCKNNGTCYYNEPGFTCQCVNGYSGDMCQHDTDECESGPCSNGGTCVDRVNGYTCMCRPRYYGDHCQAAKSSVEAIEWSELMASQVSTFVNDTAQLVWEATGPLHNVTVRVGSARDFNQPGYLYVKNAFEDEIHSLVGPDLENNYKMSYNGSVLMFTIERVRHADQGFYVAELIERKVVGKYISLIVRDKWTH